MPSFDPERSPPRTGDYFVRNDGSHREGSHRDAPTSAAAHGVPFGEAADDLYDAPAYALGIDDPTVTDRLGALDDLVFEAIAGKAVALDELRERWRQVPELVGEALVEESRQAYLRHALNKWRDCADDGARNPRLAATLLDVLEILLH